MLTSNMFPVLQMKQALAALAERNVFLGTSSWKYPGWTGLLYDEQRYLYRGKFAESRFERDCLEEYAQVFRTVCVDAGYYQFPSPQYIAGLCAQVPDGFRFGFKVCDEITARTSCRRKCSSNRDCRSGYECLLTGSEGIYRAPDVDDPDNPRHLLRLWLSLGG